MSMYVNPDLLTSPVGDFDRVTRLWRLREDWQLEFDNYLLWIKAGYESNGASIPKFLWSFVGPAYAPDSFIGAFPHDALYDAQLFPRDVVDLMFREVLLAWNLIDCPNYWQRVLNGKTRTKAYTYWGAVRGCGWACWHRDRCRVEEARKFVSLEIVK